MVVTMIFHFLTKTVISFLKDFEAHPLFIYIFLGFALCCVLFRARIRAVETGMDLELDFNSKSTWYSTVSIT